MTTWIDFTRRNDPACRAGVRLYESKIVKHGYPDVFCFWSKDPFGIYNLYKDHIIDLQEHGTLVLAQFTINNYGPNIEPGVPKPKLDKIVKLLGSKCIRLRFDPVINGYTKQHHFLTTCQLARNNGISRIITNFIELKYKNIGIKLKEHGINVIEYNDKESILRNMLSIANYDNIELAVCAETFQFAHTIEGLHKAACSDIKWAQSINPKILDMDPHPSRKGCGCCYSKDWGQYSSQGGYICPHGCLYCYA